MRQTYDERRRAMLEGLDALGIPYAEPQGAFYVYANVAVVGVPASTFCERLLAEGKVMMYPGTIYGDHTDDFVRMSLTQPVEKIREAMRRMASVVQSIRREAAAA
jgi:aminotransferase